MIFVWKCFASRLLMTVGKFVNNLHECAARTMAEWMDFQWSHSELLLLRISNLVLHKRAIKYTQTHSREAEKKCKRFSRNCRRNYNNNSDHNYHNGTEKKHRHLHNKWRRTRKTIIFPISWNKSYLKSAGNSGACCSHSVRSLARSLIRPFG